VRRTVPPSAEIQQKIDGLLASVSVSEAPAQTLSELARLGARLVIQRAVEDEFDAWRGVRVMSAGRSTSGACAT
jgi:hypothetical protein